MPKPPALPDLLRAHGAWILLVGSIAAGALGADPELLVPALMAGTGHVGAFQALAAGLRPGRGTLVIRGTLLALAAPALAVALGASTTFLLFAASALPAAGLCVLLARRFGALSLPVIATGCLAIALAAATVACAGGVEPARAALLPLVLTPFFAWRSHAAGRRILDGEAGTKQALRSLGLREAGYAALWSLAVGFLGA